MKDWLSKTDLLGNTASDWLLAALGAVLGYLLVHGAILLIRARLRVHAERRPRGVYEILRATLRGTRAWILMLLSITIAARYLLLPDALTTHLGKITYALVALQITLWVTRFIVTALSVAPARSTTPHNEVMSGVLSWTLQVLVWVLLLLALLSNAGVNVNAFIASLGVGGVAIALAAQNVLGDLFASISIGLDKPFEPGEYIGFGSSSGTVTRVGIKSTRIRSQTGEEISVSNANLLKEVVRNYSRMNERCILFNMKLAMDTPRTALNEFVLEARKIIAGMDRVRLDRGHATGFSDFGMDVEFVYYLETADFKFYKDTHQRIVFALMDQMEQLGISMAAPASNTYSVHSDHAH